MSEHLTKMLEIHKKDYSIYYRDSKDKVEKITDCRLLHLDAAGVTFIDKNKLGKNKVTFIPSYSLVMIKQEFV